MTMTSGHDEDLHGHHHHHNPFSSNGLLTAKERKSAAVQLSVAMTALCLLVLGIAWPLFSPARTGVSQLLLAGASLIVAVPVIRSAWHSLHHPSLHGLTDQLIALAMLAAWATGDLVTAALLPIIMTFGHVLEERSVVGSQEAMDAIADLTRSRARLIGIDGTVADVDNDALKSGDRVEVRAGDRIPADGTVIHGRASLDTAPITGESTPLEIETGMSVFGGAINLDGLLTVEVTRTGEASTLGKVIALMQHAENAKPPITRLLEKYAPQYLSLVMTIAAIAWFFTHDAQIMLAVLVAACPCALVLSAPATSIAGIAVAARHGILIRSSAFLEQLADLRSLVIDKTGTLTFGNLSVEGWQSVADEDVVMVKTLAASLGSASSHPVSRALAAFAPRSSYVPLAEIEELPGLGIIALFNGEKAALGRPELFARLSIRAADVPEHDGPIAGLSLGGKFLGWMLLSDRLKPEAQAAIADLRSLGFGRQILLTGDREAVARRVAAMVGIEEIISQALPEDKLRYVVGEIGSGNRLLVVGDGINDSLALKAGAVGVAMGAGGADIALASSDIILIGSDLRRLATCVRLSRMCRRTLAVNVFVGLGWTVGIVVLAAFGVLGAAGAIVAAVLHNISTLIVLANAGRLMRYDDPLAPVTLDDSL